MPKPPRSLDSLTPAYRRRLERAIAKYGNDISRSQARGHARIARGEFRLNTLNVLRTQPAAKTHLLRSVLISGDPVERYLYELAAKDKFRKRGKGDDGPPTAMENLLMWRRVKSDKNSDFSMTPYPRMGNAMGGAAGSVHSIPGAGDGQSSSPEDYEDLAADLEELRENYATDDPMYAALSEAIDDINEFTDSHF